MIAEKVKEFYEKFPYPSKTIQKKENLYKNAEWIAGMVGEKPDSFESEERILEAGCGTGEFSCAFALGKGKVFGIDLSEKSIQKAKELKEKFKLDNVDFKAMDIKDLNEKEKFDFIFSIGVLHHTSNPEWHFQKLAKQLKPNGCICIGLYNKYGRFPVKAKNILLDLIAGKDEEKRIQKAGELFKGKTKFSENEKIWLADKYAHPNEKTVSVGETLKWFDENNLEFMKCSFDLEMEKDEMKTFFGKLKLIGKQIEWLLNRKNFFVVSARKVI